MSSNVFLFQCVVQSYLQWLQDSDYNPNCSLCDQDLAEESCVRLICYRKNSYIIITLTKRECKYNDICVYTRTKSNIILQMYFTGYVLIVIAEIFLLTPLQLVIPVQPVKIAYFLQRISFLPQQVIFYSKIRKQFSSWVKSKLQLLQIIMNNSNIC